MCGADDYYRGYDMAIADKDFHATFSSLTPAHDKLKTAVLFVVDKFKKDEAQGYHTKDREFAISVLEKALE